MCRVAVFLIQTNVSQRAREKVDKYRAGYAAQEMRHAFLPAVVSTSGDKKTTRYFEALGEAVDVDSEAYCFPVRGCSPLARLATEICFLLKSWGEMYYETRKSRKRGPKGGKTRIALERNSHLSQHCDVVVRTAPSALYWCV